MKKVGFITVVVIGVTFFGGMVLWMFNEYSDARAEYNEAVAEYNDVNDISEPNKFDGLVEAWTGLAKEMDGLVKAQDGLIDAIIEADEIVNKPNEAIEVEYEDVFCDVCGESLTEWNFDGSRETMIGMSFVGYGDHKEGRRVKEVFGKTEINVCGVCLIKALGVKPICEPNEPNLISMPIWEFTGKDYRAPMLAEKK